VGAHIDNRGPAAVFIRRPLLLSKVGIPMERVLPPWRERSDSGQPGLHKTNSPVSAARGVWCALPVFNPAIDLHYRLMFHAVSPTRMRRNQSFLCPACPPSPLMLDPRPDLPILSGMERPLRCGLGCHKLPIALAPRFFNPASRFCHALALVARAASSKSTLTSGDFRPSGALSPTPMSLSHRR